MKYKKYIEILVEYDTTEIWEKTEKEMKEVLDMFNNISRKVTILKIEQGVNGNDGQNK
jgi:hypothetical protein